MSLIKIKVEHNGREELIYRFTKNFIKDMKNISLVRNFAVTIECIVEDNFYGRNCLAAYYPSRENVLR